MTLKQAIALVAGSLAGAWVRELLLRLDLAQTLAALGGALAGSMVASAITAR